MVRSPPSTLKLCGCTSQVPSSVYELIFRYAKEMNQKDIQGVIDDLIQSSRRSLDD